MKQSDIYGHLPKLKILITTPAVNSVNGGIYIILQWCNKLKEIFGHDVTLFSENKLDKECKWRKLNVPIVTEFTGGHYEVVIISSPHSIWIEDFITTEKCYLFSQMAEDKFHPNDLRWVSKCLKFYRSPNPMYSISLWNIDYFFSKGRKAVTRYISNGMDFNDFPIERIEKDGKTVLLESPDSHNPTKDADHLALKLAGELKRKGYMVLGYGAKPLITLRNNITNYSINPDLSTINKLYRQASILIKATKFDARALAPLEAMTKGCITSRSINSGDDDLLNNVNAMVCKYDYNELKEQTFELLENHEKRRNLTENGLNFIAEQTWEKALEPVNQIITS